MVGLNRRERKREQTKQALINAAVDLFIARGYCETTIDDIVNKADVAKVTFYYYFKSKEEIVSEIKAVAAEHVLARSQQLLLQCASALNVLEVLFQDVSRWTEENGRLLHVFLAQRFSSLSEGDSCGAGSQSSPFASFLERIIIYGQQTGEFRKLAEPAEMASFLALAVLNEQCAWIRSPQQCSLEQRMTRCIDFVLHGIASDASP